MIVTNVVKSKYVVKVFNKMLWGRRGGQLDQFIVDAESLDSAKLQAENMVPERMKKLYGDDFPYIVEVTQLRA